MKFLTAAIAAAMLVHAGSAAAQAYPSRNIVLLQNSSGGVLEAVTRAIIDRVKENTGATLVLENRLGAGGALALQATKRAAPDGYTMGLTFASALNLNPLINKDLDLDPIRDFAPVTNLFGIGAVYVVKDDATIRDLRDLIAMAKARPGSVSIGIFGAGHKLWLALIEEHSGAKFLQVPMKSSDESLSLLLGNHIQATISTVGTTRAQKGKIRAVAFGGPAPSPLLPGVPTTREMYGAEAMSWFAVVAPAATPPATVGWMSRELARAVRDPKIMKMIDDAAFTAIASSPEEFAKALRSEVETNLAVLKKYPEIR